MTRAERRAAARAGLVCKVCGRPLDAQRSTARYCSDACRMAACRTRGPRPFKGRLCPGQIRILAFLSEAKNAHTRKYIAEGAGLGPSWLPVYLGHVDPERRDAAAARTGVASLLGLGYVREVIVGVDGEDRRLYEITADGREALARCINDEAPPP